MAERIITDFEYETGMVARSADRAKKFKSIEDFRYDISANPNEYVGVMYDDRAAFLEANDYKLTRRNLINAELSDRITPDETADVE